MTDLEITKLCADAMGLEVAEQLGMMMSLNTQYEIAIYDPLHNDAQVMALVKKFNLEIFYEKEHPDDPWLVNCCKYHAAKYSDSVMANSLDLNRAICECVAKMMQAKNAKSIP